MCKISTLINNGPAIVTWDATHDTLYACNVKYVQPSEFWVVMDIEVYIGVFYLASLDRSKYVDGGLSEIKIHIWREWDDK